MRSAAQLKRTPAEWAGHRKAECEQALVDFLHATRRARETNAPWYLWIVDRQAGKHRHNLRDEHGRTVACPVPGCRELDESANPHTVSSTTRRSSRSA